MFVERIDAGGQWKTGFDYIKARKKEFGVKLNNERIDIFASKRFQKYSFKQVSLEKFGRTQPWR